MADAFTSRLNLTKPEVNASASTWGNKWNANADTIDQLAVSMDQAFAHDRGRIATLEVAAVPIGGVIAFAGATIPAGYRLCDGQNGTPDLRDRFIAGAGLSYGLGGQAGTAFHTLSVHEMPVHAHGVNDPGHAHGVYDPGHTHGMDGQGNHQHDSGPFLGADPSGGPGGFSNVWGQMNRATSVAGHHAHNIFGSGTGIGIYGNGTGIWLSNNGGGGAHENRPPFTALYYIMRVA